MTAAECSPHLHKRIGELAERAARAGAAASVFLTPAEQAEVEHLARSAAKNAGVEFSFFGGPHQSLDRRVALFYSETETLDDVSCRFLSAVRIKASGYEQLSHGSYLGAIMALGVERDAVGDIIITDDGADVVCTPPIAAFLSAELTKVGRDTVSVAEIPLSELSAPNLKFTQIRDTVASCRLDCIVAALCNLSRTEAERKILSGAVTLCYRECKERAEIIKKLLLA